LHDLALNKRRNIVPEFGEVFTRRGSNVAFKRAALVSYCASST
jgi:hypothetical protein